MIFLFLLSLTSSLTLNFEQIPNYGYPTQTPHFSSLTYNQGSLYCFGGSKLNQFSNDLKYFNLSALTWLELAPSTDKIPTPRMASQSFIYLQKLYIFGGQTESSLKNDLWSFDFTLNKWENIECTGEIPIPRRQSALILNENIVYLYGGDTSLGYDSKLYE